MSTSAAGVQANGASDNPEITTSANGTFVAFDSVASNLIPGDLDARSDVFVKALANGLVDRVSQSTAGLAGNADAADPASVSDGRFVRVHVQGEQPRRRRPQRPLGLFVRNRANGTTERVSVSTAGVEGDRDAFEPAISSSGKHVAFSSKATNLVPADTNFDRTSSYAIVGRPPPAGECGRLGRRGQRRQPQTRRSARAGGSSRSSPRDEPRAGPHGTKQILVHDLALGQTDLVSARADGTPGRPRGLTAGHQRRRHDDRVPLRGAEPDAGRLRPQLFVRGTGAGPDPNCALGESSIVCELLYGDGVGPVAIRWYVNRVHVPASTARKSCSTRVRPAWTWRSRCWSPTPTARSARYQILPCLTDRSHEQTVHAAGPAGQDGIRIRAKHVGRARRVDVAEVRVVLQVAVVEVGEAGLVTDEPPPFTAAPASSTFEAVPWSVPSEALARTRRPNSE